MDGSFSSDDDFDLPVIKSVQNKIKKIPKSSSNKLAAITAASQRVFEINRHKEINEKVEACLKKGTVLDRTERVIQEHKETKTTSIVSPTDIPVTTDRPIGSSFSVPGVPFFINPIKYMTSLDSSPLQQCTLLHQLPETLINTSDGLRDLVQNKFLLLVFQSHPCPSEILHWLLDISCLSSDYILRICSFRTLMQLLQQSNSCSVSDIQLNSLLGKLGAATGADNTDGTTSCDIEHTQTDKHRQVIQSSVNYIACFLKLIFTKSHQTHITSSVEEYITILIRLVLDPSICHSPVAYSVWTCIEAMIATLSVDECQKIEKHLQSIIVSNNIFNSSFIIQSLPVTAPKLRQLQHQLAKLLLIHFTKQPTDICIPDHEVATNCVSYYLQLDPSNINYTEMYSIATILALFLQNSNMKWPSVDVKNKFLDNLNHLVSKKLRETVMNAEELGPVKDLIIRLELNMKLERDLIGMRQSTLFDNFIDSSN